MGDGVFSNQWHWNRRNGRQNKQLIANTAIQQPLLAQQVQLLNEQIRLLKFMADTLNRMENRQIAAERSVTRP